MMVCRRFAAWLRLPYASMPAGAEEAREHSVDFLFHFDTEELGIEVDLLLEDIVC